MSTFFKEYPPLYRAICRDGRMHEFWNYVKACDWLDQNEPIHATRGFHNVVWQKVIIHGAYRPIHHVTHVLAGE